MSQSLAPTPLRVAINGFGRIGRTLTRLLLQRNDIELVAIHDVADLQTLAHLFKYDSVHGRFNGDVQVIEEESTFLLAGKAITYLRNISLNQLPWSALEIDVVVDCTGLHKTASVLMAHLQCGAKRVILSAPPEDDLIPTIVRGVNDFRIDRESIISCASCTTNNAAPMIQLLDELCGIESCFVTTVHSYTGDQRLHDAPHKDLRRARAAATSIIPTSTGAAKALTRVFPHLAGSMGGCGMRVPVPDGSLTDITCNVRIPITAEEVNAAFRTAAQGKWKGILEYTDDPIVSVDVLGNGHSCVFDAGLTTVIGSMVKVVGWYDNESGYSHRLCDMLVQFAQTER